MRDTSQKEDLLCFEQTIVVLTTCVVAHRLRAKALGMVVSALGTFPLVLLGFLLGKQSILVGTLASLVHFIFGIRNGRYGNVAYSSEFTTIVEMFVLQTEEVPYESSENKTLVLEEGICKD